MALTVCIAGVLVGEIIHLENKIASHKKSTKRKLRKLHRFSSSGINVLDKDAQNPFTLPKELEHVPMAENQFILSVKNINIRNVFAPHNASLIENDHGYLLFFRYDIVRQMHLNHFNSHIGVAELDREFNQTENEFTTIDTGSDYSEDPRVFIAKGKLYLTYNDIFPQNFYSRSIRLAEIDLKTSKALSIQNLDVKMEQIEKNWAPFAVVDDENREQIHFEYQLFSPRKILKVDQTPEWLDFMEQSLEETNWSKKWGAPRGGAPARLIDGEYVSFFHSSFVDNRGIYWYLMGAYTFEAKPPFKVTAISPYPIFFRGIYNSKCINTADVNKFVIFPAGFAIENKDEKTILHLGCGENDGAVKIISMDKDKLLKSLKKFE